mgnify:CR=1 FL=1
MCHLYSYSPFIVCTVYPILWKFYLRLSTSAKKEHNSSSKGATFVAPIAIKPEPKTDIVSQQNYHKSESKAYHNMKINID